MSLLIGKDRQERLHYLQSGAPFKGCNYQLALCAKEVLATDLSVESTQIKCINCNHAYDLGLHLSPPHMGLGAPKQSEEQSDV
jgi:hypothetical protein